MATPAEPLKPMQPIGPGLYVLAWLFGLLGLALLVWWGLMTWGAAR